MSHSFTHGGWTFTIDGNDLSIDCGPIHAGTFCLAPQIEHVASRLGAWKQESSDHFSAAVHGGAGVVHVAREHGHVCYWFETTQSAFASLSFFPRSSPTGRAWQTYLSDEHDRLWDINVDADVQVSSCYPGRHPAGEDGKGMLDPGDNPPTWIWNIPVRACSLKTDAGWLGISIPGPIPVGVTRFVMSRRRFSIGFEALRSSCKDWPMPKVYFVTGLQGAYDVLDKHRTISEQLGLVKGKDPAAQPDWWSQPLFKYWDEMCRRHQKKFGDFVCMPRDEDGNEATELTTANLLEWMDSVSKSVKSRVNITLEQGAFLKYGEYIPTNSLGGVGGLRKTIDSLRERGTHTALFFHIYHVDTTTKIYQEHPEYFCRPKPDAPSWQQGTPARVGEQLAYIDWTHPGGRKYMLDLVEFLVSDKPGCLNCDYLAVNNNIGVDPRYFDFHDPEWGIGDLMQYKTQRLIYETAKRIKPESFVRRQSAADCYMQPFADNLNCCEHWFSQADEWYRRAQIVTRLMPDVLFSTDAWFVTLTKNSEYYMSLLVWNIPEIESVTHAIHPYLIYRPMRDKDYRRRKSGIQVYLNAPQNITDQCRVTWPGDGTVQAWRKRTRGPLEGFYAALALSRKALVTYSETEARIACAESRFVEVPMPPGASVHAVEMVPHDSGAARQWPYEDLSAHDGPAILMHVEDCGDEAMYYRVRYSL